jgi:hypothetical protein
VDSQKESYDPKQLLFAAYHERHCVHTQPVGANTFWTVRVLVQMIDG